MAKERLDKIAIHCINLLDAKALIARENALESETTNFFGRDPKIFHAEEETLKNLAEEISQAIDFYVSNQGSDAEGEATKRLEKLLCKAKYFVDIKG